MKHAKVFDALNGIAANRNANIKREARVFHQKFVVAILVIAASLSSGILIDRHFLMPKISSKQIQELTVLVSKETRITPSRLWIETENNVGVKIENQSIAERIKTIELLLMSADNQSKMVNKSIW